MRNTIGNWLVEKPELISFPSEPTRREIAAYSVIVAGCGVPNEGLGWQTIDDAHHPDQRTGRKVLGPIMAELIIEDQPKGIVQFLDKATAAKERSPSSIRRAIRTEGRYHLRASLAGC